MQGMRVTSLFAREVPLLLNMLRVAQISPHTTNNTAKLTRNSHHKLQVAVPLPPSLPPTLGWLQ